MKDSFTFTIRHVLERGSVLYGNRIALAMAGADPKTALTYEGLLEKVNLLASHLYEQGIKKGDKVALLGDSHVNWPVAYFAIVSIGATVVPILPDFSKKEITTIIDHSEARALVVSSRHSPKVVDFIIKEDSIIYRLDDLFFIPKKITSPLHTSDDFLALAGVDSFQTTVNAKALKDATPAEEDLACIIYTSGTTGASKGVMLSHKNITSNAYASRSQFIQLYPGEIMLSILPLSHSYEFSMGLMVPLIEGCQVHYLGRPPAAHILLPVLKEVRPHLMFSVPLLIERIYKSSVLPKIKNNPKIARLYRYPLFRKIFNRVIGIKLKQTFGGRLRFFGVGGAALDKNVEQFLKEAGFPYAIGYGITETSPLLAGAGPKQTKVGSTGFALNNVELRIDPSSKGEGAGEIQARGPSIMMGYYKNEALTAESFTEDGWFKTGDLGLMHKGRLSINGRLKTMILGPSGENIYPEFIEMLINNQPYVEESLIVEDGKGLVAMIKLDMETMAKNVVEDMGTIKDEALKYLENIRESVNKDLGVFSRISSVKLQDEPFEKTPTLKIKRYLYSLKEKIMPTNTL